MSNHRRRWTCKYAGIACEWLAEKYFVDWIKKFKGTIKKFQTCLSYSHRRTSTTGAINLMASSTRVFIFTRKCHSGPGTRYPVLVYRRYSTLLDLPNLIVLKPLDIAGHESVWLFFCHEVPVWVFSLVADVAFTTLSRKLDIFLLPDRVFLLIFWQPSNSMKCASHWQRSAQIDPVKYWFIDRFPSNCFIKIRQTWSRPWPGYLLTLQPSYVLNFLFLSLEFKFDVKIVPVNSFFLRNAFLVTVNIGVPFLQNSC